MAKDYYAILGLSKSASAEDIKKAYRKLSKELHPDKHKGDKAAETKFKDVNEAYEALSNPEKRRMYDQFGTTSGPGFGGGSGAGGPGFGGFDFSGFTGGQRVDFSDLFENFFGGGGPRGRREEHGDDREVAISISFAESVSGVERVLRIRKFVTCSECKGSGAEPGAKTVTCADCGGTGQVTRTSQSFFGVVQQRILCPRCKGSGNIPEKPCKKCSGEGRMEEAVSVTITVPAGIDHGQTLRMRGEGDVGRAGTPAGDLYVRVEVTQDARFVRDGDDIRTELTIPVIDAILGADASVETVHGLVTLSIPAGTQPGQVFRIKGKGMPVLNTSRTGDQYVTVNVEMPTKLSREERRLLEEWRKLR